VKPCWSFGEDRQWSRSALRKNWGTDKLLSWFMEVRTEDIGAGSIRLGEMIVTGSITGDLTMSIAETE
jgi:hypothetical protein